MKVSFRLPLMLSAAILPFILSIGLAQQDAPKGESKAAATADKADAKAAKPRAKPRGRLPAYYGKVVDGKQREKIYAIQQQYEPKISALKAELQAMQDKADAEIDAVLTAEQRDTIKKLADEAKQKRKATASATASATTEASPGEKDDDADADAKPASGGSKPAAANGKIGK
jgi:hypothetical protein